MDPFNFFLAPPRDVEEGLDDSNVLSLSGNASLSIPFGEASISPRASSNRENSFLSKLDLPTASRWLRQALVSWNGATNSQPLLPTQRLVANDAVPPNAAAPAGAAPVPPPPAAVPPNAAAPAGAAYVPGPSNDVADMAHFAEDDAIVDDADWAGAVDDVAAIVDNLPDDIAAGIGGAVISAWDLPPPYNVHRPDDFTKIDFINLTIPEEMKRWAETREEMWLQVQAAIVDPVLAGSIQHFADGASTSISGVSENRQSRRETWKILVGKGKGGKPPPKQGDRIFPSKAHAIVGQMLADNLVKNSNVQVGHFAKKRGKTWPVRKSIGGNIYSVCKPVKSAEYVSYVLYLVDVELEELTPEYKQQLSTEEWKGQLRSIIARVNTAFRDKGMEEVEQV